MENLLVILILALSSLFVLRFLLLPVRLAVKIAVHSGCGFLCLWLLNTAAGLTGVYLPINAVTVLLSGFLGIPGIALVALLELRKL